MFVIRPVSQQDVPDLLELAHLTGFGLTTLPRDQALLERRVRDSQRGFEKLEGERPAGERYLFVLENRQTRRIVGTSGLLSKVGGFEPFYAYRIETEIHHSRQLRVRKEIRTLHLVREHSGPSEVGSLFLHPDARQGGLGRLLSLSRFLFVADHRDFFDAEIITELRGVVDENGHSPFWEAVGRHFFDLEYVTADYLSATDKQFIADLMPVHPIYIPLLPPEAQTVIARPHDETVPAQRILEAEGFRLADMVDIFEAGPVLRCPRDQVRSVKESRTAELAELANGDLESPPCIVSNTRRDFRACLTRLEPVGGRVRLPREAAGTLELGPGDPVRWVTLRTGDQVKGAPR
ncbi:MAG: arginine N-succinyltransferase [Phycisphaeraceae bacterium]